MNEGIKSVDALKRATEDRRSAIMEAAQLSSEVAFLKEKMQKKEDDVKFIQISSSYTTYKDEIGNSRTSHILCALDSDGYIWEKMNKEWFKIKSPSRSDGSSR